MANTEVYSLQFSYGIEEDKDGYIWFKRTLVNPKGRIIETAEVYIYDNGSYRKTLYRLRKIDRTTKRRFSKEEVRKLKLVVRTFLEEDIPDYIKIPVLENLFLNFFSKMWIEYAYRVTYPYLKNLELAKV